MKHRMIIAASLVFIMLSFLGCAPKEKLVQNANEPGAYSIKEVQELQKPSRETWDIEWETTLKAAKKEGKVVLYSASVAHST